MCKIIIYISPPAEGPFLIACGPDDKPEDKPDDEPVTVYWQVKEDTRQVHGTTKIKEASLFYIIKTDSSRHPYEFYIGYVGKDLSALERPKGPADPLSKSVGALAPIPQYVTADPGMMGSSDHSLRVTAGTHKNHARFTLHSSTVRKYAFTRAPVDSDKWAEGGGFFINCSRRMFKLDGYVAMDRHGGQRGGGTESQEPGQGQRMTTFGGGQPQGGAGASTDSTTTYIYTTSCKRSVKSHSNSWPWMVFHLLPGEHKDMSLKNHKLRPEELGEPLIDRSEYPIVYQSDERDFQLLFGNPTPRSTTTELSS